MGFRGTATSTGSDKKYGDRLQNRGVRPGSPQKIISFLTITHLLISEIEFNF